jgi:acyl carrier protein
MDTTGLEAMVLQAMRNANLARDPQDRLEVSPTAVIFGPPSPLDSLGLVALLIDIEEGLREQGCNITLSDERAMSQTRSPFRTVPRLVAYIASLLGEPA